MPVIILPGDKLEHGHYTVIKEIGVGGMGMVYHCRDELLMRDVAIKVLLPDLMSNKLHFEVFTQEARVVAQLEHPNIVTIFDIGTEEREGKPYHYLAMEYLPGGNLALKLKEGALSVEHCLNWMKQLAYGLSFAHKRGIVHQDIKADNIFLTNEGDLKIGDFGLAKLLVGRVHQNPATKGMGTPAYMSPELCRGDPQDHRSDIYSLGILFFEMATGQLPFKARGMIEMALKHSTAPVPSVRRVNPNVPEALEKMIRQMMAKNAEERFQSVSEIVAILEQLIFELRMARLGLRNKPLLRTGQAEEATASNIPDPNNNKPIIKSLKGEGNGESKKNGDDFSNGIDGLELRWTHRTKGPIGWASHPVVDSDEKVLYIGSGDGHVYAIDTIDGARLWKYKTGAPILSSPVLTDENLVVTNSAGEVLWLSTKDGVVLKHHKLEGSIVTTPTVEKNVAIIPALGGNVQALDLSTGSVKWQRQLDEQIVASPQYHAQQVLIGTKSGLFQALSPTDGTSYWSFQGEGAVLTGSAVSVDSVYFGTQAGTFYALDLETGKLMWEFPTARAIISKSVIVFTSVIFCSQDHWLYCCEKYGGNLIWKSLVKGTIISGLVHKNSQIFLVTNEGWLQCFSADAGELMWQKKLGRCIESTPTLTSKMLFMGTVEGDLLAYSFVSATANIDKAVREFA